VPGEGGQHITSTATKADTAPSPKVQGVEDEQLTPSLGKTKEQNAELGPEAQNVENEQPLPTTETNEGTLLSSTHPNNKGDAADIAASSRPRPRLWDSFKIRG